MVLPDIYLYGRTDYDHILRGGHTRGHMGIEMRDLTLIIAGIFTSAILIAIYLGVKHETIVVPVGLL